MQSVKNLEKGTHWELNESLNDNKTKDEQCSSSPFESQNVKDDAVASGFVF